MTSPSAGGVVHGGFLLQSEESCEAKAEDGRERERRWEEPRAEQRGRPGEEEQGTGGGGRAVD